MKLKQLKLRNFRGYNNLTINISDLNVVIGKNDVGKSTILDALDIYFNGKPDIQDLNVYAQEKLIEITCVFEVSPNYPLILDDSITTTLQDEMLLNVNNDLEISKIYEGEKLKEKICLIAKHPTNFEKPLITLKITDLQKQIKDKKIDTEGYRQNVKKDLRKLLFENTSLVFDDHYIIETSAKDTDIQNIFSKFEQSFPVYLLFRADRTNTDKDGEVSDTLNAITKTAVSEIEQEFQKIKQVINEKIIEIANKTLEKLKNFDSKITDTLTHEINNKPLEKIFDFTFQCNDGISFNKRGSGVKRLMLLSFFLAESERDSNNSKNIIYAIEEPETSQHPDFQQKLIASLKVLSSEANRQIIITTHTPEIVKMVDKENLIFLQKNENNQVIKQQGSEIEVSKIRDTLGILPFVSYKGVIFVEGSTDVRFLKTLCRYFSELKNIIDLTHFTIIPLHGCGNVELWLKEDYLKNSNVKCLYFKDRDDTITYPLENQDNVIITQKREIENYIPISHIERYFNISFTPAHKSNWDNIDVADALFNLGVSFGDRASPNHKKQTENTVKVILSGSKDIWDNISADDLDLIEMHAWFNKMKVFFED